MSNAFFPTLPGTKMEVKRRPRWKTTVHTSRSGREQRIGWWNTTLYEFELHIEVLRQGSPYGSNVEAATLSDFYNARQGAFDTFFFTDPLDGTTRTVRFKEDQLEFERIVKGVWRVAKVLLVEVRP